MIMPYCNSCLAPSRDIKGCQFEAVQCQKSREVCFKVWQKTRQDRLLKSSTARLAKPKLAAAVNHWLKDWRSAQAERLAALGLERRGVDGGG